MHNFVIHTDAGCDIRPELLNEWGVTCTNLTLTFEGENKEYSCTDIGVTEFYERMRQSGVAKTAAANIDTFVNAFEPTHQQGKDILYPGFSSGLSTTCNSAHIAAQQLLEPYPQRKIRMVDTLAASAGYIENLILNLSHWFTVDDLEYLKCGGRVIGAHAGPGTLALFFAGNKR